MINTTFIILFSHSFHFWFWCALQCMFVGICAPYRVHVFYICSSRLQKIPPQSIRADNIYMKIYNMQNFSLNTVLYRCGKSRTKRAHGYWMSMWIYSALCEIYTMAEFRTGREWGREVKFMFCVLWIYNYTYMRELKWESVEDEKKNVLLAWWYVLLMLSFVAWYGIRIFI